MKIMLRQCGEWIQQRRKAGGVTFWHLVTRIKSDERGQGTTEYAILVGVLVVIAIIAVVAFRDNLQELWESISESINSL